MELNQSRATATASQHRATVAEQDARDWQRKFNDTLGTQHFI
jgi:hypothetical protein